MLQSCWAPRAARPPELQSRVRAMIEAAPVSAITRALEAMMARRTRLRISRHLVSVLVVVGAEDVITPVRDAESMQQQIVRSRLVVIPERGICPVSNRGDVLTGDGGFLLRTSDIAGLVPHCGFRH